MADTTPIIEPTEQPATGIIARIRALTHNKEFERFWKFAVVGTIGAVIDNGTFNGLLALGWLEGVEIDVLVGTLNNIGIAGLIAFTFAVISNFIWNRYWTYPDSRSKSIVSQLITFFGINIVGGAIRVPILQLGSQPLANLIHMIIPSLEANTAATLGKNAAWTIAVIIVMFWNFFVNRYWTYNDVE